MLTEKQAKAIEYYYNEDYSLAEIADITGISRQGVRDNIKRAEILLYDYDEKAQLLVGRSTGKTYKVGDKVKKGQTLCIIEAMKLMNEIESEYDGKIAEVFIKDGEPVDYGKPLFRIV